MRGIRIRAVVVLAALLVAGAMTPIKALEVGAKAPDFTLPATTQEKWSLSDLIGKKNVVFFSFIGAFTPT
jgi:cytochrome oxidase Cu insertion factor (SCO1/SenC/PrrC family)